MKIIRFEDEAGRIQYGRYEGRKEGAVEAETLEGDLFTRMTPSGKKARVTRLLAPVVPVNILCIGRNYVSHAEELGNLPPENPILFMKNTAALQHPHAPIRLPACQMNPPEVDYEGELVVVIGKAAHNVSEAEALDHVLGYTAGNDVSARHWQKEGGGGQWCRGKGFDTFCPLGPCLSTPDDIGDPQDLRIRTRLNGEIMQDGHTSHMIFPIARLIAFLSQGTTLLPGTVILTGTPAGVGFGRDPQVFLKAGDAVEIDIEKIGILENPVEEAS